MTEQQFEAMRLPRAYWNVSIERLPERGEPRRKLALWVKRLDDAMRLGYGFVFFGKYGQGKTSLLSIALRAAVAAGRSALFMRSDAIPGAYMEREEHSALESLAQRMTSVDVLGVDDLGQERFDERGKALIERVVRARYDRQKALVITTNSLASLRKGHEGIERLVLARCEPVELAGMHWAEAERKERGEFFRTVDCEV